MDSVIAEVRSFFFTTQYSSKKSFIFFRFCFNWSKNAQAEDRICQACLNHYAEAQPLFCKECYCFRISDYKSNGVDITVYNFFYFLVCASFFKSDCYPFQFLVFGFNCFPHPKRGKHSSKKFLLKEDVLALSIFSL